MTSPTVRHLNWGPKSREQAQAALEEIEVRLRDGSTATEVELVAAIQRGVARARRSHRVRAGARLAEPSAMLGTLKSVGALVDAGGCWRFSPGVTERLKCGHGIACALSPTFVLASEELATILRTMPKLRNGTKKELSATLRNELGSIDRLESWVSALGWMAGSRRLSGIGHALLPLAGVPQPQPKIWSGGPSTPLSISAAAAADAGELEAWVRAKVSLGDHPDELLGSELDEVFARAPGPSAALHDVLNALAIVTDYTRNLGLANRGATWSIRHLARGPEDVRDIAAERGSWTRTKPWLTSTASPACCPSFQRAQSRR